MSNSNDDQADAVIQVAAYHPIDLGQWLSSFNTPHNRDSVELSLTTVTLAALRSRPATIGCSILERLPPELFCAVSDLLPAKSWFYLRHVNRRVREILTAIPQYHAVATHGQRCLMLVLQTGLGNRLTFHEIYSVLLEQNCKVCGQFGGSCTYPQRPGRVLAVFLTAEFLDDARVSLAKVQKKLPVVRTRRDVYPHRDDNVSWTHFDAHTCFEYQIGAYVCNINTALDQIMWKYLDIESEDSDDDGIDPGSAIYNQIELWGGNAHQAAVMASAPLPVFNPTTSTPTLGFACKGCAVKLRLWVGRVSTEDRLRRDRLYTREEFLAHYEECPDAQMVWNRAKAGIMQNPDMEEDLDIIMD